jgi:hypothetical protein
MSNGIKYTIVVLLVIALCAPSMIATETNAQTCGCGAYGPSYGYYSQPGAPMIAPVGTSETATAQLPADTSTSTQTPVETPAEATTTVPAGSPETLAPTESPITPATGNMSVSIPAQSSGYATVSGIVTYNNGTLVPGAIVQLQSKYGAQYSSTSDSNGHYEISNVKYDTYTFKYRRDRYESPAATLDVNTSSIKRDISLPALLEGSSTAAPAASAHSDIGNWYATRYTPQKPSNKAVIYDQSGHITRVITGTCRLL